MFNRTNTEGKMGLQRGIGMNRIWKIAILDILVATLVLPTGAQAHDISVGGPWRCGWWGGGYCGYGGIGDNHTWCTPVTRVRTAAATLS